VRWTEAMKYETRLRELESRLASRGDAAELAGKIEQARARVDAHDHECGIVRPPHDPLFLPPEVMKAGLAEHLVWARNNYARRAEAHR
jgi:hypothetical protein